MDIIAAIFTLLGIYVIGNKLSVGFILHITGDLFWMNIAISNNIHGLTIVAIISILINIRNYYRWRLEVPYGTQF